MAKIIILGAGVIGLSSAYSLADKGHDVVVIDAAKTAGEGASFANGAQLSYSKTYPLSNLSTLKKLPQLLFSKNSPIHIHTGFDIDFFKWGLQFVAASFQAEANAKKVLDIALKSRELMHSLVQRHELNFDYARAGKMFVFDNAKDFEASKKHSESLRKYGIEHQFLSAQQAVEKEPALADMQSKIHGAIYSAIDESGDAKKFCEEMLRLCENMGVKFHLGEKVERIVTENGRIKMVASQSQDYTADYFVMSMGAQTNQICKQLGIWLPIYPMKGYSLTIAASDKSPKINITDEARRLVYSRIGDRLRIAGVAEFCGNDLSINRKIVDGIIASAKSCFPNAGDYSDITEWAGLRPMTPSTVPIIEKSDKYDNLLFNTGHGMLGWTLAMGSAEKLAGLLGSP